MSTLIHSSSSVDFLFRQSLISLLCYFEGPHFVGFFPVSFQNLLKSDTIPMKHAFMDNFLFDAYFPDTYASFSNPSEYETFSPSKCVEIFSVRLYSFILRCVCIVLVKFSKKIKNVILKNRTHKFSRKNY